MGIGKIIKYGLLVGALVGVTAYATHKYHDQIEQKIVPRINRVVEGLEYTLKESDESAESLKPEPVKKLDRKIMETLGPE